MSRLTVGVCPDFAEERWPSMERVAGQLLDVIGSHYSGAVETEVLRPAFSRRAMRWSAGGLAYSVDRACNRFIDYPRYLRRVAGSHDVYHIVDHSYAHLTRHLPAGRCVVTCHDLDAFRSILESREERRSPPFRAATRYILGGVRRASAVVCDTAVIAEELVRREIVSPERVFVAHLGAGEPFTITPDADADESLARLLPFGRAVPVVLHVGATIPRKRIDVLLRCFAAIQGIAPAPRLVHVGQSFTDPQSALARQLGVDDRVTTLSTFDDRQLAAVYRRAAVLALPSDREGFGFPVVEALRSGTAVVASDLAVLREVGGAAARYCPAGDVNAWAQAVAAVLMRPGDEAERSIRTEWGASFTWQRFAEQMTRIYSTVAERRNSQPFCVQAPA
jgi:glycosyltransferase involved in cell wall biosynthesis